MLRFLILCLAVTGCVSNPSEVATSQNRGRTLDDLVEQYGPADRSNKMELAGVAHVWDPYNAGSSRMTCGLIAVTTSSGEIARLVPFGAWPQCR